ncbi:MAG: class I tRNA ligase family protein, partial [Pseudomonadales bacterium]|nr:class I tRNA ligase family protein [Pseudomonadales bacterium]
HCWRCDSPLFYRAITTWFLSVAPIKEAMQAANAETNWVPAHLRDGRFGNWLANARDWAISRNRYWGTPLPVWKCEDGHATCLGSVAELQEKSGATVVDLHKHIVDDLVITCPEAGCKKTAHRIEEVLDCWFESGSMPYAQVHYPFENKVWFESNFPADFIAEGLDQTRGWFYSLTVLGTALFGTSPFRNVIVNGLVLAEDGKKMSKRLRNYTPPDALMETYGADALRLYLINSGLVRGEEQRFADSGVRDMVRRALLPWYNAFSFLKTYAEIDQWSPDKGLHRGDNILDQWILSRLQTLKANVSEQMEAYRLYNVVPKLFEFIEELTNWYIRLNRTRYWGAEITADKIAAFSTLYQALEELSLVMAPFAPFLAEHLYLQLAQLGGRVAKPGSVHLCDYPEKDRGLMRVELELAVDRMQQVILLGRQRREEARIGLRTPLRSLVIIHSDAALLDGLRGLEDYIKGELNVLEITYDTDESAYIQLTAKPNFPLLGKRLGKQMKSFQQQIQALTPDQIAALQETGSIEIGGECFDLEEIQVQQLAREGTNTVSNRFIAVDLDCRLDDGLIRGGYSREIVNRIQQRRKELGFNVADRIRVTFEGDPELLLAAEEHREYIATSTLAVAFQAGTVQGGAEVDIDSRPFRFSINRA